MHLRQTLLKFLFVPQPPRRLSPRHSDRPGLSPERVAPLCQPGRVHPAVPALGPSPGTRRRLSGPCCSGPGARQRVSGSRSQGPGWRRSWCCFLDAELQLRKMESSVDGWWERLRSAEKARHAYEYEGGRFGALWPFFKNFF